jgi:hypothetical protein
MDSGSSRQELRGVLRDVVEGKTVKRSVHELKLGTYDVSSEFMAALDESGYIPTTVSGIDLKPGERIPAFHIESGVAFFGWVFWEKFSRIKLRKLFGSVARNSNGDWAIQLSDKRATTIYANPSLKTEMDIENPSSF